MNFLERTRSRFSSSRQAVDPHLWNLPSSYGSAKANRPTPIPDPALLRNAFIPTANSALEVVYPDISHAAVHLGLLECFYNLKHSAIELGVQSQKPPDYSEKPGQASSKQPVQSDKWDTLLQLAVTRFETWWDHLDQVFSHATTYAHHGGQKAVVQLGKDYIPPLDVLFVWYAFMLELHAYRNACEDRGMPQLQHLCFPWPAIRDSINWESAEFELSSAAKKLFLTLSRQSPDILQYLSEPPAYTESIRPTLNTDLHGLVKKQEKFMGVAHELLWIRSPALRGSLERSLTAYYKCQSEGSLHEDTSSGPFGVELIWRTDRLFPAPYWSFSQSMTLDSAPVIDQLKSSTPEIDVATTADLLPTAEDNLETTALELCYCWTCERIRDEVSEYSRSKPQHSEADFALVATLTSEQLHSIEDDIGFYRQVEDARQAGRPLPTRSETVAEKAMRKREEKKKSEAGVLPGLGEYIEVSKDGKRRIKRAKQSRLTYGMGMAV